MSFGLYLHLPFCKGRCPYCAFYSLPASTPAGIDDAIDALEQEARRRRREMPSGRYPETVYFGGGTPSLLSVRQFERVCGMVRAVFLPPRTAEWTVECNPESLDSAKLEVLKRSGVNRISLGAQSLDDAVLRRLGRRHDAAAVTRAAELIRASGFTNWNIDLMACVPGTGAKRWQTILRKAVALNPAHVSVYALTLDEGRRLPSGMARRRSALTTLDDGRQLRILRDAREYLEENGYYRYEISNYARRGRRCRHHCDFWQGGDYIGLGPGAVSRLGRLRRRNVPDLAACLAATRRGHDVPHEQETLSVLQSAAEHLVIGLRMTDGIRLRNIWPDTIPGPGDWPNPELRTLAGQGLVWRRRGKTGLTERGFDVADAVALELWPVQTAAAAAAGR